MLVASWISFDNSMKSFNVHNLILKIMPEQRISSTAFQLWANILFSSYIRWICCEVNFDRNENHKIIIVLSFAENIQRNIISLNEYFNIFARPISKIKFARIKVRSSSVYNKKNIYKLLSVLLSMTTLKYVHTGENPM